MAAPKARRTTLDEALEHIAREPTVWSRFAATVDDADWSVRVLELTTGREPPPTWDASAWEYPNALLAGDAAPGEAVAQWLQTGVLPWGRRELPLATTSATVSWDRQQSRWAGRFEAVEWPTTEANLAHASSFTAPPFGPLIGRANVPSFVDFGTACANWFGLEPSRVVNGLPTGIVYRHQDDRGRISAVRITERGVDVVVEGKGFDGSDVELAGDVPGPRAALRDRGRSGRADVTLPIAGGLPSGAWVVLRHDGEWLDRRFLSPPLSSQADVEVVVEPRTKLEGFLVDREGPGLEFKRDVPTDDGGKRKVMRTVCAFANGRGGSVLFGIDDDYNAIGVPAATVGHLIDRLTQSVRSWVAPVPQIDFDVLPTDRTGASVIELRVAAGTALFGCGLGGEQTVYIRHHATTVKARPDEMEALVRARTPSR